MKKIILIITAAFILAGCQLFPNEREAILDKANKTAEGLGYQYETTKMNVENKVKQVNDAADQIKKAADQVQKATDEVQKAADALKNVSK